MEDHKLTFYFINNFCTRFLEVKLLEYDVSGVVSGVDKDYNEEEDKK